MTKFRPRVTYRVALEVSSHEAVVRRAYKDSVGKWTWSVGLTSATGHKVERYIDNPQPLQHCLNVYIWALRNYAQQVVDTFAGYDITEEQFAAALSFHWNTGGIKRARWIQHWKDGNIERAREAFMAWSSPPEIIERREKERDLFFDGTWSNNGTMTEYTRVTKRHTPVWASAKVIDVRPYLLEAIGRDQTATKSDHEPQPDAPVDNPTLSPEGIKTNWLTKLIEFLVQAQWRKWFGGKA